MNIKVEKLPKSEVKLTIEIDEERTKKLYEKASEDLSKSISVPGFRPGHVPMEVLKKHLKEGALEAHMLDIALPETYAEAVKKENINVVSSPKVKVISSEPLKYEAVVAIYPDVKIEGYDKLNIKKESVKVEDSEIDEILLNARVGRATYTDTANPSKKGDKLEIDFEGFDDGGAPLENTSSKNHPVIIGEGTLIEGFEEELIGLKKDDEKEFDIKFKKDYFHKPFQNKKVKFKVKVHKVQERNLPELDKQFLKELTGTDKTLEEVKKDLKEELKNEKTSREKIQREDKFLDKIADLVVVEIPQPLLEEEIDSMIEEFKSQIEGRGLTLKDFLEQNKKEIKDLREERKSTAEKRLRLRFGLHQIFEQEKIVASEDEINEEIEQVIALYPDKEKENVKKEYSKNSYLYRRLENKIKIDKLFARYLEK